MPKTWQIGTGDYGRHYFDLFRKYDVMFLGPGDPGAFDKTKYKEMSESGKIKKGQYTHVYAFANSPQPGDIVLAREGHKVAGIGVVHEEGYRWREEFDDIYGWDLQHTRRIVWQPHLDQELNDLQETAPLFGQRKQIPTFTAVHDKSIIDPIKHLFLSCRMRDVIDIAPEVTKLLEIETLGEKLFSKGLPFDATARMKDTLQRLRQLGLWYTENSKETGRPTEHEVVAHMLIPLLTTLGWSVQNLAVEWNKIDLAGFSGVPSGSGNCVFVCEAKGLWFGLQGAFEQARNYAKKYSPDAATKILTTDGLRLYIYEKRENIWQTEPTGYFNVLKFREKHICPANTNAVDTIMALTPAGMMQPVGK